MMLPKDLMKACRWHAVLLISMVAIGGCLPTSEIDTPDDIAAEIPADNATVHRLSGSVGDGPVTDAQVRISTIDGRTLMTTTSSATASYDISVEAAASDYPLLITATGGTDLVTLAAPDFEMKSVVKNSGENSVANLNPFTTIAIELASDLQGGVSPSNIDSALRIVVRELNSGLSNLAGSAVLQSAVSGSNIADLVRASEALGELVRRTRDALSAAGQNETGNSIVAALGSDLVDGILDGRGGPRANARIAAVAGVLRAQIALETMQNQLRVQGTDATARMETAMAQVFTGNINPGLVDLRVTAELVNALEVGAVAANALQPSAAFATLIAETANLSAGMSSTQIGQAISGNARSAFDTSVVAIASGSAGQIEAINEIFRTGVVPAENTAPVISGTPDPVANVGTTYDFRPNASDSNGDSLDFSISGKPSWATFDTNNGRLSGTPLASDVGSYQGIVISVSDGLNVASLPAFSVTVQAAAINTPPTISGSPASEVLVSSPYQFTPQANDVDGDELTFSVQGLPSWADFNATNGRISGTPEDTDAATYSDIQITVSDGQDAATLGPFSITVNALTFGSATLSWTPPTVNTDGTPLTDLAAYKLYWGSESGSYTESVTLSNPGLTAYVVDNLSAGNWYFVITSINAAGVESSYSDEAAKLVQ